MNQREPLKRAEIVDAAGAQDVPALRAVIDRAWPALGIEFDAPGDPFDVGRYSHVPWGVLRAADLDQDNDAIYGAFSALDAGRIPADLTWVRDRCRHVLLTALA